MAYPMMTALGTALPQTAVRAYHPAPGPTRAPVVPGRARLREVRPWSV